MIDFCIHSYMHFVTKKTWQVAPPIKSKKMKVAVIIFLYKGVVNVNQFHFYPGRLDRLI